jgi:thiol-disulfide isomerase/thioredoxin
VTSALALAGATLVPAQGDAASAEISVPPIDSARLREIIDEHRGKVVVVNMWATWCPPCIAEFPHLVQFAREATPEEVAVIGITSDYPEDVETQVIPFLRRVDPPFPNYLQDEHEDIFVPAVDPRWTGDYPHTAFYGPEGDVVDRMGVFHSAEELRGVVERISGGSKAD